MKLRPRLASLTASIAVLCSLGCQTEPERARIGDFSWLAGTWAGPGHEGLQVEQSWTQPSIGAMTGTHIARAGDDVKLRGELRLVGGENGVVLLGSPEGRPPANYRLTDFGSHRAEFANRDADPPQICRFERSGNALLVTFESIDPLGGRRSREYRLERVGPPPR